MDYTIQEASKKLNVSRMTVYNKIDKLKEELKPYLKVKKGVKYITEKGIEIIILSMNSCKNIDNDFTTLQDDLVSSLEKQLEELKTEKLNQVKYLQSEIEIKNKQLEAKDKQLESKDELLKNFQVLLGHEQQAKALLENKLSEIETKKDLSLVGWLKNIFYRPEKI